MNPDSDNAEIPLIKSKRAAALFKKRNPDMRRQDKRGV
jgi:hypothetical protein